MQSESCEPDMKTSALFTDLYELTMAQAYATERMDQTAVFELTFRKMPANRNYIVAAGIGDVLEFLSNFRLEGHELDYLRRRGTRSGAAAPDPLQVFVYVFHSLRGAVRQQQDGLLHGL